MSQPDSSPALHALAVHMYATQRYGAKQLTKLVEQFRSLAAADEVAYLDLRDANGQSAALDTRRNTASALRDFSSSHPLVVQYDKCEKDLARHTF